MAASFPPLVMCIVSVASLVGALHDPVMVVGSATKTRTITVPPNNFATCYPVGMGTYNGGSACFLASTRNLIDPRDEVLPIPVEDNVAKILAEAMQPTSISGAVLLSTCPALINRDGGLYDKLPWDWSSDPMAKREAHSRFMGKGLMGLSGGNAEGGRTNGKEFGSAYELLADVVTELCPSRILGLLIEEDAAMSGGVTLGGAVYLERRPQKVKLMDEEVVKPGSGGERAVVESTCDEAVGLALALGKPVMVERAIWEGATVRPNFTMAGNKLRLNVEMKGESVGARMTPPAPQPPAWTIKSKEALARMDVEQRRACLQASGVKPPRKRITEAKNGMEVLEELLLALMDETVRRDIRLTRALQDGDMELATALFEGKSERHVLLEQIQQAIRDGDKDQSQALRQRLDFIDRGKQDPTLDEGSYSSYLDADEWYLQNLQL